MLPFESVEADIKIIESIAQISIISTFHNPENLQLDSSYNENSEPIEFLLSFPKFEKSVVKKLTVMIGDERVVEA